MRIDAAVIGGKCAAANGAVYDVVLGIGCSRLLWWDGNGIGEDRMAIRKETTTFAD